MRIIGSDYDGTLNYNGIDEAKIDAIERWRKAGNVFALISGRAFWSVKELYEQQKFGCDYLIGSNGAAIAKPDGEIVFKAPCDPELVVPLITYLFELGCPVGLIHTDWPCNIFPSAEKCVGEYAYALDDMPEIPYYTQISTYLPSFEEAAVITEKVRERFAGQFNPLQNGNCIDIVRADMNKAQGLYRLMELLGASYEDIIAVGDNINDRDMIAEFRSYAMENGVEEIKELADYTTVSVTALIERELADSK